MNAEQKERTTEGIRDESELSEALEALRKMVNRYASSDPWECPMECDTEARMVLDKHGIKWRDERDNETTGTS